MESKYTAEEIWELYEKGVQHHRRNNLYVKTEQNYNFFDGNQWVGVKTDGYEPPSYNIIQQIVRHKYSNCVMQNIELVFDSDIDEINEAMNLYGRKALENINFDKHKWTVSKDAAIAGDSYLYITDGANDAQVIDNTSIYFSDETSENLQEQKYIIISERLFVSDVKEIAAENGIPEAEINYITSDEDNENKDRRINEVHKDSKCTSLLFMYRENGTIHFLKCVRNCIYQPAQDSQSRLYPIASYVVSLKKYSSRGIGNVAPLIPNQIELNKTLFRRAQAIKNVAFPKMAFNKELVRNPEALNTAGAVIGISGTGGQKVSDFVSYLNPGYVGNDAKEFTDELIVTTKELNSSGDGALGQVNPETSSGAAIQALTQQANIALTEQLNGFVGFVESVGKILIEFWKLNNPGGIPIDMGEGNSILIDGETLGELKFEVSVSSNQPMDKMQVEQELKQMFLAQVITFEEFVESLDDDGYLPKAKLKAIADKRAETQRMMAELQQIIDTQRQVISQYEARDMVENVGAPYPQEIPAEGEPLYR